ncbi:unnamed protein product, partial [Mesorhabditis belari]|uniref:G-protein coupled receptors family 1 profile domain-containing protein n=1 Tax=Mesorhabditis belari TaxID=2138241 RepID=A0AAF3FI11_9BILA
MDDFRMDQTAFIEELLTEYAETPILDMVNNTVNSTEDFVAACDTMIRLTRGPVEIFLYRYFLPVQILFGIAGNTINLAVLLSSGMRSEANVLLSAMAFMDIALFVCHFPYTLTIYPTFYRNALFRELYYKTHLYFHSMSNVFSASASWLVLAVSLERYIGIRSPMHTRLQWNNSRVFLTIILIFLGAGAVSFYHFFEHTYDYHPDIGKLPSPEAYSLLFLPIDSPKLREVEERMKAGQPPPRFARLAAKCYSVWKYARVSTLKEDYIMVAKIISICLVVFVPLVFIPIFNLSIIRVLRNRDILVNRTYISAAPRQGEDFVRHYSEIGIRQKQERKVTATVVAIITCHIFTHFPSAFPFLWELVAESDEKSGFYWLQPVVPNREIRYICSYVINSVLLWGKVLNFVLFCLSSEHFRKRMFMMFRIHCNPIPSTNTDYEAVPSRSKKYSSVASNSQAGVYKGGKLVKLSALRDHEIQRQNSYTTQIQELTMNEESTC